MSEDVITVYWAPSAFDNTKESWHMLYQEPTLVRSIIQKNTFPESGIRICPSVKQATKNLFSIKSSIDDTFKINLSEAKKVFEYGNPGDLIPTESSPVIAIKKVRDQEYKNHYNYGYNLSWLMFADHPVEMRMSSPYMPPSTPMKNSFLPTGQLNVGQWYRDLSLEYITPVNTNVFSVNKGQDLVYFDFLTDSNIVFKKYTVTDKLRSMADEFVESPSRYGVFQSLKDRYSMSKKSRMPEMILSEIKKNVVE